MQLTTRDSLAGIGGPAPSDPPSDLAERALRGAGAGVEGQDARKVSPLLLVEAPPNNRR